MPNQKDIELSTEYNKPEIGFAVYDPADAAIFDATEGFGTPLGYTPDQLSGLSVEAYTGNTFSKSDPEFRERLQASVACGSQQFTWRA